MMKRKLLSVLLAIVTVTSLLTGCGGQSESSGNTGSQKTESGVTPGGTMLIGMAAEPITLNPDGKNDDNMSTIAPLLFSKLMKVTGSGKIICDLAESYEISEDGLTYTFQLPADVKFSDGKPLTSEDVKFTFEEIVKQGCFAADSLSVIKEITCPDDQTVVITLSKIDATFLGNLGYNGTFILPRHIYEGQDWMGDDSMQEPVGSGPFVYDNWASGVSFSVKKNENFYLGPDLPYLDGITYSFISDTDTALQAFNNGELDILGVIPSDAVITSLMNNQNYKMCTNMYASRFYIGFNMEEKPFDDINFRMAVAHGIDIDSLIDKAMKTSCVKAETYLSPLFSWACNKDESAKIPEYNKDKALEYMEATGLKKDADGYYCHITMDTYNYEPFPSAAQVLKAQLAEIGIDVSINMLEYAAWDETVAQNHNFQMTVVGGYIGPDVSDVSDRIVTGGYFNFMGYSNPELDKLMEEGMEAVTEEERAPYYQKVCQILRDDMPMIMIGEWVAYTPIPTYVHGFPLDEDMVDTAGTSDYTYTWMESK